MNATIEFLDRFRRLHPTEEKIFIVPAITVGRQLGQALAEEAGAWLNFRFLSLPALALEILGTGSPADNRRLFSKEELLDIIESLICRLRAEDRLKYLKGGISARSLAGLVRRSLDDLRHAGIEARALDPGSFIVKEKGSDLVLLLEEYENDLKEANGRDLPGLYRAAMASLAARDGAGGADRPWYLSFEARCLPLLDRELLSALAADRLVLVPRDPVFGLDPVREDLRLPFAGGPTGDAKGREPGSDAERLAWLFDPASAPSPKKDGSLTMFRAAGASNECREILRRLMDEGTPFDRAEVILSPGGPHSVLFHLLARQEKLNMTFADGVPLALTSSGRAFFGLLNWLETGHSARKLADLFETGDLVPLEEEGGDPDALPGHLAGRLLLEAGIGWGRERYSPCLKALEMGYAARLEASRKPGNEDLDEDPEELQRMIEGLAVLRRSVEKILDLLPKPDQSGLVDLGALCLSMERILEKFGTRRPTEALDEEGGRSAVGLLRRLRGLGPAAPRMVEISEAIDRLRVAASDLRVGRSSPRPGHLHVSGLLSGGHSGRPVTFVVGLGEAGFPGRERQDPLLLDEEREAVSPSLETSADRLRFSLYNMAGLLSSLRGRVILSYSDFDVIEERPESPSSLMLQVLRLMEGASTLDYSALDGWFAGTPGAGSGYVPGSAGKAIDETDWWLFRLGRENRVVDVSGILEKTFSSLASGLKALEARNGESVTGFDGLVKADPLRYDPRRKKTLTFSATRLEKLAACPYAFFLRYLLGVEPPEEIEFDPAVWLDARNRGSLLHKVFCDFMSAAAGRREKISYSGHHAEIVALAEGTIEEYRRKVPPPSERVFEYERDRILADLDIFLKVEEARDGTERPFEFEKAFSVPLDLGVGDGGEGEDFQLAGFIDRIDSLGPGLFRVIDYKTGGYGHYEGFRKFGRGRLLQPSLYALAVEKIHAGDGPDAVPEVRESGYLFPTVRGEGRELMFGDFDRGKLKDLLRGLLDIIAGGLFMPTADGKDCGYCDYAKVCGGAAEAMKAKCGTDPDRFRLIGLVRGFE